MDGVAVDLILRDVTRVADQCARAARGEFAFHAQTGHPLGFLDIAYAGEIATCVPLCDPAGVIPELARIVTPYPEPLRAALIANMWQVDFLLNGAKKGVGRADVAYVVLCAATAMMYVAHGWHAAAGQWVDQREGPRPERGRVADRDLRLQFVRGRTARSAWAPPATTWQRRSNGCEETAAAADWPGRRETCGSRRVRTT